MNMLILKNIRSRKEIFNILLMVGRTECQPPKQQNERLNNCCWELKYQSLNMFRHGLQKVPSKPLQSPQGYTSKQTRRIGGL